MKIEGAILYKETQHFRVKWLWAIIIICMLSPIGINIALVLTEKENSAKAWTALAIVIPLEALLLYLFYIVRLEIIISDEGVYYKWWPFLRDYRFIAKAEVKEAALRNGPALSYGFHFVPGYGRVHNMGPGKGFQFLLKNDKKIFLGTRKQSAFQNALEKIMTVSKQV